jgi:hypothetical protein
MKPSNDHEAISLILTGLVDAGCTLTGVVEDNYCPDEVTEVSTIVDTVSILDNLDEATVYVDTPDGVHSFIYFVMGNSPEEVACDLGVSLSKFIDPIIDPWW